ADDCYLARLQRRPRPKWRAIGDQPEAHGRGALANACVGRSIVEIAVDIEYVYVLRNSIERLDGSGHHAAIAPDQQRQAIGLAEQRLYAVREQVPNNAWTRPIAHRRYRMVRQIAGYGKVALVQCGTAG